jgi:ankyrin repeat protein
MSCVFPLTTCKLLLGVDSSDGFCYTNETYFTVIEREKMRLLELSIGLAISLELCNCAFAQATITFTNKIVTFTNLQGQVYRGVQLVRADTNALSFRWSDAVGGGRISYTNLSTVLLDSLGIPTNWVNGAMALSSEINSALLAFDLERVKLLIRANPRLLFSVAEFGGTPLQRAADGGHEDLVEFLLAAGSDVNARDNTGWTPLHCASNRGHKDVVRLLLASKADVNAAEDYGRTPLAYAAMNNHKDVVSLLLKNKADVNAKEQKGVPPLHWAARAGHKDVVELLLTNGADVNAQDKEGITPLHCAAESGNKQVMELLLTNKAEVNCKSRIADTPLHWAAIYGNKDAVQLLLASKADVNAKNIKGKTPLDWIAGGGGGLAFDPRRIKEVADLLRENGGQVTPQSGTAPASATFETTPSLAPIATLTDNAYTFGSKVPFAGFTITFSSTVKWTRVNNSLSTLNGAVIVGIPVTVKNVSDQTATLNMFSYKVFGSQGTTLRSVNAFFEDNIDFMGALRPGASKTSMLYMPFDGNGNYYVAFDEYPEKLEVKLPIRSPNR